MFWNETIDNDMGPVMRKIAYFFLYFPYVDIKKAELMYRHEAEQSKPILGFILMDGPSLYANPLLGSIFSPIRVPKYRRPRWTVCHPAEYREQDR